jgi:hypothetical protein
MAGASRAIADSTPTTAPAEALPSLRAFPATVKLARVLVCPALECEIHGISPHPSDPNLYYAIASATPRYPKGWKPKLPAEYRGKLLLIDSKGKIVSATDGFEGIAGDLKHIPGFWLVLLTQQSVLQMRDNKTFKPVAEMPIEGNPCGMEYDDKTKLVSLIVYSPQAHMEEIDLQGKRIVRRLWADENSGGLARVGDSLLCTWTPQDHPVVSELWLLDSQTGNPIARMQMPGGGLHWAMAALDPQVAHYSDFMTFTTVDQSTGQTEIRVFSYTPNH